MSFSPIPIFQNVDMEVDVVRGESSSNNLSSGTRIRMPTFNLSGITYGKSNSSQNYNDIVELPSGYSYYIIAGVHGGSYTGIGDYSWIVRVQLYDEDASADTGSRSYYANKSSSSNAGGPAGTMQWFGRLASCVFLPNLSSNKRLSLKLHFTNGPFRVFNYVHWTIYRTVN